MAQETAEQVRQRLAKRLEQPSRCGCGGEYSGHDSCRDRQLIADLSDLLASQSRALEEAHKLRQPDEHPAVLTASSVHQPSVPNGGDSGQLQAQLTAAQGEIARLKAEQAKWLHWSAGRTPDDPIIKDYNQMILEVQQAEAARERLASALKSIANNSCCTPCREAALVAKAALATPVPPTEDPRGRAKHPCGHDCYPGSQPTDWCIECRYGDKPYH